MTFSIRTVAALAIVAAAALGACDGGTDPHPQPGAPAAVEVVDGNGQVGTVGQPLPQPVRVRVVDARGRPVPGQAVNFVVTSGYGSVAVDFVTSDAEGIAAARWTLGTRTDMADSLQARVGASDGAPIVSEPITATARPGAPARLEAVGDSTGLGGAVNGPVADSLRVRVLDQYGNPVSGADVSWAATEGGGSASPATSTSGADGVARAQWTLGPRTDVVQGATASIPGAARAAFYARAANQIAPSPRNLLTAPPGSTVTASVIGVGGTAGPVPGVRVHWAVLSGGGSVSVASSVSSALPSGVASTQWTLGPSGGTQTLLATAGTLQTVLSVTVPAQGSRILVTQVSGPVLDVSADRVLWAELTGNTRRLKIRTLATGEDVTIKTDEATQPDYGAQVGGYLFDDGALIWTRRNYSDLSVFEYRGGTLSLLSGPVIGTPPSADGNWAAWISWRSVIRRDLSTGTSQVIAQDGGSHVDVADNGHVVYGTQVHGRYMLYTGGAPVPVTAEGEPFGLDTDGTNLVYATHGPEGETLYLDRAGGDVPLMTGNWGYFSYRLAGGWTAYSTQITPVRRRSPAGVEEQVTGESTNLMVAALSPDGTVVYRQNFSSGNSGAYYMVLPNGARSELGVGSHPVIWRDGRFLLLAGGSVYELRP